MKTTLTVLALATWLTSLSTFAAAQRPGSVDLGFEVRLEDRDLPGLAGDSLPVEDMIALPDGRIYIAGGEFSAVSGVPRLNVARLFPDGSVDPTFEITPEANTPLPYRTGRIFLQSDGKLLGSLGRFLPDGALDRSFHPQDGYLPIAIRPDGKAIVLIEGRKPFQLHSDGQFDTGFSTSVFLSSSTPVALSEDGELLVVSNAGELLRLGADGALDRKFEPPAFQSKINGTLVEIRTLVLDARGRILVGGVFDQVRTRDARIWARAGLARLASDGSLDTTFDATATLVSTNGGFQPVLHFTEAVATQADGKIYVGGQFLWANSPARKGLVRLNPDGSLDYTFDVGLGIQGICSTPSCFAVKRIVLQPDGQILVSGLFNSVDGVSRDWIARLNGDGRSLRIQGPIRQPDGATLINVTAPTDTTLVLEATSTLSPPNWQPFTTNTITTSPLIVTDPDAAKFPQRFYRAVSK